jgi:O-succinylbenzoic acid--CoA ligase
MAGVAGAVVLLAEFKAASSLALVARERVSYTLMVPACTRCGLREPALAQTDLSSLRLAGFGGAPMRARPSKACARTAPASAVQRLRSTETSSPATMTPPRFGPPHGRGQAAALRRHPRDGRGRPRSARDTPGEVWIAGPMVVPRYWENPQATRDSFVTGYWKSGDIGTMDADGYLYVHDRKKDMINRGGYKVFSVEVENCLVGHPAVQEAATVGVPCPVLGERIHAFVMRRA